MSKAVVCSQAFCGIDVSAATLAVALERGEGARLEQCAFANSAAGYRRLIGWLRQRGNSVRVSLALETVEGIEVAVLNPKTVHRFAQTLPRSKTDQADARALAEYSLRNAVPPLGAPPARRRAGQGSHPAEQSAARRPELGDGAALCAPGSRPISLAGLHQRIARLRNHARAIVRQDAELLRKFQQLLAIPGIGETSAVQLLSELAGLDPAHRLSGTSLHLPSRISRHLRRALYMPALVGVRWDLISRPSIRLSRLATKPNSWPSWPSHANCSMPSSDSSRQNTPYDGATLFPQLLTTP